MLAKVDQQKLRVYIAISIVTTENLIQKELYQVLTWKEIQGFPGGSLVKNRPTNAGDTHWLVP